MLFKPGNGQAPFLELTNTGPGSAALDAITVTNALTESFRLPGPLPALLPDEQLLIVFDGQNRVEGHTVHADRTTFLDLVSDAVTLTGAGGARLDRVAWGRHQPDPVPLGPGGFVPALVAGATVGRHPGALGSGSSGWLRYPPEDATPGGPNPVPSVEAFPMMDGLVSQQPEVLLEWYPVRGAASYHVQLAADETFASTLVDAGSASSSLKTAALPPGDYLWRVKVIGAQGAASRYSAPQHLTVESGAPPAALAGSSLAVPMIKQHKDTSMLLMESQREHGDHAWDVAHPDLDKGDPADNSNCGLATVAMIAAYYHGNTSQDRLGYELRHGDLPGPEGDLFYSGGTTDDELVALLGFALGPGVVAYAWLGDPGERDAFWESVKLAIDSGKPVPLCGGHHCVVIYGYNDGLFTRRLLINDPWRGPVTMNARTIPVSVYAFPPGLVQGRNDENGIGLDSDSDGIVDFDETMRFGTDPHNADTDEDRVPDLDDVRVSVFDPQWGYANFGFARSPFFDDDPLPPERDEDSDGAGCLDGVEDSNHDGVFQSGGEETSALDASDDRCVAGQFRLVLRSDSVTESQIHHTDVSQTVKISMEPKADGRVEGAGVFRHYHYTKDVTPGRCESYLGPFSWSWPVTVTGRFQGDVLSFNVDPPSKTFTVTPTGTCGGEPFPYVVSHFVGWADITFTDGVYEYSADTPHGPPDTGNTHIELKLKRKSP